MNSKSRCSLLATLIAALSLALVAPAHASSVFGRTSAGTVPSGGLSADYKRGSKFTLSEPAVVSAMYAYLDGFGGPATGFQEVTLAIYQDANGAPGIKVGESNELPIMAQSAAGWRKFYTDGIPLPPGTYWLVMHSGGSAGIARNYGDGAPNWYGNADSYGDEADSPFGTGSAGSVTLSIYAEYAAAGLPKYAGRSTIAATPSGGLSADFKRASKVTLSEAGRVTNLSAYLDGRGGVQTGAQQVRLALYRDLNGVPGAIVTETSDITIPSGRAGEWVSRSVAPATLQPGSYWVAIHSGTTAGIIRDYGDGAANWYGNADNYADHAVRPFGTGSTGTVTMSVGFMYLPGPFQRLTLGRTSIGSTPSGGLTADYARSQVYGAFTLPQEGPISGFWAYLDGNGGASGTQQMRIALYGDDCYHDYPPYLHSNSEVVNIVAGQPAGWVFFPLQGAALLYQACGYWLTLESGGTQGVARDYADGTGTWRGVHDTFSDGPASEGPTYNGAGVSVGTGQLSMYLEYDVQASP